MAFNHPIRLMNPTAPSSLLAMTTASATAAIPLIAGSGRMVELYNEAATAAYFSFGTTAAVATGFAIEPGSSSGLIEVPDQTTALAAILNAGAGNLRITYCSAVGF